METRASLEAGVDKLDPDAVAVAVTPTAMVADRVRGAALFAAAGAYTGYTLWLIGRMLWVLRYSMTSAVRNDELVMLHELRLFHEGKYGLGYLWAPYFGQRTLIPRLVMMADERFFHFSNTPLVVLNLLAQCGTCGVLLWAEWRLLRQCPAWLRLVVMSATAQVAFSSLQIETFAFGMSIPLTMGLLGGISCIFLASESMGRGGRTRWAVVVCAFGGALLCAFSQATGVFLGPVILVAAYGLRASLRFMLGVGSAALAFGLIYSLGYSNPGGGMGLTGALTHPIQTIRIAAIVLGGPITNQNVYWGASCGCIAIAIVALFAVRLVRRGLSRAGVAFTCVCLYLVLSETGIAIGRFTPANLAILAPGLVLPSRYLTTSFLFWGALLALVVSHRESVISKASCMAIFGVVGYLTLHTVPTQRDCSFAWLNFHRNLDVAGAGMIVGATDPKFLFQLTPDQNALNYYRPYMKEHRLSFFADARAAWLGRDLVSVFGAPAGVCRGRIEVRNSAGPAKIRVEGFVAEPGANFPWKREIVMTDGAGKIDGIGNTLGTQTHGAGLDFVAYADDAAEAAYWIQADGRACRVAE